MRKMHKVCKVCKVYKVCGRNMFGRTASCAELPGKRFAHHGSLVQSRVSSSGKAYRPHRSIDIMEE
jgi:hypothetical protein